MVVKAICRFSMPGKDDVVGIQCITVRSTFKRHLHSLLITFSQPESYLEKNVVKEHIQG